MFAAEGGLKQGKCPDPKLVSQFIHSNSNAFSNSLSCPVWVIDRAMQQQPLVASSG